MQMWGYWLAMALVMLAVAATLVRAVQRAREEAQDANTTPDSATFDIAVYRDQLSEIDRDIARGTLPPEEGARLKTEVSRRLLEADRAQQVGSAPAKPVSLPLVAGLIVLAIAAAGVLYWRIGAPGYPDLPLTERLAMSDEMRAARISQAEAEAKAPPEVQRKDVDASFLDLMAKLRQAMKDRPDDLRGLDLLARNEAGLGNFKAAKEAQARIVGLKGDAATSDDVAALAEMMILATGGYVSPEAEQMLTRALTIDRSNGLARFYSGEMFAQVGRYDRTFVLWRDLLENGPQEAPWIAPIRAQLPEIAARAGVKYDMPPAPGEGLKGPTAGDMAAAAQMSETDRKSMIEGMVAQLGDRLATQGGSPEEWARLISSLGVLGRADEAKKIYAEALTTFKDQADALQVIKDAGARAGVAE